MTSPAEANPEIDATRAVIQRNETLAAERALEEMKRLDQILARFPEHIDSDNARLLVAKHGLLVQQEAIRARESGEANNSASTSHGVTVYLAPEDPANWASRTNVISYNDIHVAPVYGSDNEMTFLSLRMPNGGYHMGDGIGNLYAYVGFDEEGQWSSHTTPMGVSPDQVRLIMGDAGDMWIHPSAAQEPEVRGLLGYPRPDPIHYA